MSHHHVHVQSLIWTRVEEREMIFFSEVVLYCMNKWHGNLQQAQVDQFLLEDQVFRLVHELIRQEFQAHLWVLANR